MSNRMLSEEKAKTKENKKFQLELKESLLIMRDKPSFNRNIRSAPLYLFDKV